MLCQAETCMPVQRSGQISIWTCSRCLKARAVALYGTSRSVLPLVLSSPKANIVLVLQSAAACSIIYHGLPELLHLCCGGFYVRMMLSWAAALLILHSLSADSVNAQVSAYFPTVSRVILCAAGARGHQFSCDPWCQRHQSHTH